MTKDAGMGYVCLTLYLRRNVLDYFPFLSLFFFFSLVGSTTNRPWPPVYPFLCWTNASVSQDVAMAFGSPYLVWMFSWHDLPYILVYFWDMFFSIFLYYSSGGGYTNKNYSLWVGRSEKLLGPYENNPQAVLLTALVQIVGRAGLSASSSPSTHGGYTVCGGKGRLARPSIEWWQSGMAQKACDLRSTIVPIRPVN